MVLRICLIGMLLTMAGCQFPPPWIQLPHLNPGSAAAQRESFTQHDPLPDSSLGPSVSGRPREALIQRGEPRRTQEAAIPTMIQSGGSSNLPAAQNQYPQSVVP